jgi:hypothetical protein
LPIACDTLDLRAATRWAAARRMFWRGRSSIGMIVVFRDHEREVREPRPTNGSQDVHRLSHATPSISGSAIRWAAARRMFWPGRSSIGMIVVFAIMKGKFGSRALPLVRTVPGAAGLANHWTRSFLVPESWSLPQKTLFGCSLKNRRARQ